MKNILLVIYTLIFMIVAFSGCGNSANNEKEDNEHEIFDQSSKSEKNASVSVISESDMLTEAYTKVVKDYYDDGSKFEVDYYDYEVSDNPLFHRKYYRNGQIFMEGPLLDEVRQGKWISWYENGIVWSSAEYKNGKNHGSNNVYYENGQLRYNKEYDMGVPHGLWQFFCPDGNLLGEIKYNQGEIEWENDYMN